MTELRLSKEGNASNMEKRHIVKLIPTLILVALCLALPGCGGSSSSSDTSTTYPTPTPVEPTNVAINGSYLDTAITAPNAGTSTACPGTIAGGFSCGSSDTFVFDTNDNTVTWTSSSFKTPMTGNYSVTLAR